jgi:toxin FitB
VTFLIDTNIISETRKAGRSSVVMDWLASNAIDAIWTSTVNLAELDYGAAIVTDVLHRKSIEIWITETVRPWFGNRILHVEESSLRRWLILLKQAQKHGHPAPHVDLLLAAIALDKDMTIATRDVAPFVASGAPTFNPFTSERFNGA